MISSWEDGSQKIKAMDGLVGGEIGHSPGIAHLDSRVSELFLFFVCGISAWRGEHMQYICIFLTG